MITLYHGSFETNVVVNNNNLYNNLFDGVFASRNDDYAASHGTHLLQAEIDQKKILDTFTLEYQIEKEALLSAINDTSTNLSFDAEEILDLICEDGFIENDEDGSIGWEIQRIKGQVAKKLGYEAVECKDEHGISILVVKNGFEFK